MVIIVTGYWKSLNAIIWSGNDWENPEMIKKRKGRKVREKWIVMTTEDNNTTHNFRRIFYLLWMESCSETRRVIVVKSINVKMDNDMVIMLELMKEWIKRSIGIWWQGWRWWKLKKRRKICWLLGYRERNIELIGDEAKTIGKDW